ncbi:MAG TPA: MarR family transcriptional regulator [Bacteroidales bacterium]
MDESEIFYELNSTISRKVSKLNGIIRSKLTAGFIACGFDLTAEMYSVLRCLWEKNGINQQELSAMSNKEKANLTKLIDNLEKRGLVHREMNTADRRNKLIFVTKKGLSIKDQVLNIAQEIILTPEQKISTEKLTITKEVLDTLLQSY